MYNRGLSSIGVDEGSLVAPELLLPALVVVLSPLLIAAVLLALLQELLSRSNEVLEDLVNELISRLLAQVEQDDGDNNRDVGSERVDGVRDSVEHVNRLLS